jgi:hypothetical protein
MPKLCSGDVRLIRRVGKVWPAATVKALAGVSPEAGDGPICEPVGRGQYALLAAMWPKAHVRRIAACLGTSPEAVVAAAQALGLPFDPDPSDPVGKSNLPAAVRSRGPRPGAGWTPDLDARLRDMWGKHRRPALCQALGKSRDQVMRRALELGLGA